MTEMLREKLAFLSAYRLESDVTEAMILENGKLYYLCPRCGILLERKYVSYCDHCGQHLGWKQYRQAKIICSDRSTGENNA